MWKERYILSKVSATCLHNPCCWHFCIMEQNLRAQFREGLEAGVGVCEEKHRDGLQGKSLYQSKGNYCWLNAYDCICWSCIISLNNNKCYEKDTIIIPIVKEASLPSVLNLQALVVVIYLQALRKTWAGVQTTYTEETQLMNCFATQRKNSISFTKSII